MHPNRLGRGLPLQRPAGASSAGPWRERGEGNQSHWAREFNHAQRLRPAMKPTARDPPWPAHCSEQRKGPEPGAAEAAWRHKAPREPREGVEAARPPPVGSEGPRRNNSRHTKQGRRSNRMTQAGENSAGGARHPEDGKPRSRHPGLSSKPPSCEPAPGPARPGARARGPAPGRVPARPVQANMDRRKPGTSPRGTGPRSGPGWVPGRPAGRPGKPRVGSGVPRQRVAAEGLKKRRPRTACDPIEHISSIVGKRSQLQVYRRYNQQRVRPPTSSQKWRTAHEPHSKRPQGRGSPARGPRWGLEPAADQFRAAPLSPTAPRPHLRVLHSTCEGLATRPVPCGPDRDSDWPY